MMPSLQELARVLGGKVWYGRTGPYVAAPGPAQKGKDRSLSVWLNGGKIRVHSHRAQDWRVWQAHVRERCGLGPWTPTPRERAPKQVPFSTRNMFFGETLAICRHRARITFEQVTLLINDMRLRGDTQYASRYARAFGFTAADCERAMQSAPRNYTADERAKVFSLSYAERQLLGLRRTGSVDVDRAGRERARRDRYNSKRRAAPRSARAVKSLASIEVPSSQKVVGKNKASSDVRLVTPFSKIVPEGREWCEGNRSQERALRWGEGRKIEADLLDQGIKFYLAVGCMERSGVFHYDFHRWLSQWHPSELFKRMLPKCMWECLLLRVPTTSDLQKVVKRAVLDVRC